MKLPRPQHQPQVEYSCVVSVGMMDQSRLMRPMGNRIVRADGRVPNTTVTTWTCICHVHVKAHKAYMLWLGNTADDAGDDFAV